MLIAWQAGCQAGRARAAPAAPGESAAPDGPMASEAGALRPWQPAESGCLRSYIGRTLSVFAYPALFPYSVWNRCEATAENARWWRNGFAVLGTALGGLAHFAVWRLYGPPAGKPRYHGLLQVGAFLTVDHPYLWLTFVSHHLIEVFTINRSKNRLQAGQIKGPRVLVVGNGPSAMQGAPMGEEIDKFDEVVRFNNFQTKASNSDMARWLGTKCTVHFSDGVLYPTYKEYHVPGATIMLSLFADRFIVSGSYVIMRGGADLQTGLTLAFLKDPDTVWIDKERIERLKKDVGLTGPKHPTSGLLAIDYFLHMKGVQLPLCIHGFDFFMGPTIHYYHDSEPIWERINNHIGVNMHSPHKEKVYVEKLIAEGKVRFLNSKP
mmetsp:Transcript_94641/g.294381  ORF Transcript_94641/g.294381 Transcript_94641/m.294381 type:complete len:378 (+) Transcript_94641:1-1134(+)